MSNFNNEIVEKTVSILPNAYAPYSNFPVACTLINEDGEIFQGVNVENASYGLTICAERSAIANMASKTNNLKIKKVIVLSKSRRKTPPCGACRQVISEFATSDCQVILPHGNDYKTVDTFNFTELLPNSFELED